MHERARHGIGYLPQEASVFRKLTVEENILAIVEVAGVPRAQERASRVDQASHLEELSASTHVAKQKAYTLSGGERRRLEIARALVTKPKVPADGRAFRRDRSDLRRRGPEDHFAAQVGAASASWFPIITCARPSASWIAPTSSTKARCSPKAREIF
jgi:ABC-type uncharacterized transport system YnjBCD ATPase subunit